MMTSMSKEDKIYQARNDARTLVEAENILADNSRRKAASSEAKKMVKDVAAQVKTLSKIANKSKKR